MSYWKLAYKGKDYTFEPDKDLTLRVMRSIKGWYGSELGSYKRFMDAFGDIDPEACACVIWIARSRSGEAHVREPKDMEDFAIVDDFLSNLEFVDDAPVLDPTPGADDAREQTPDSTPTPTNSGEDTSESSQSSVTSPLVS